jgi:hypothetical protein
MTQAPEVAFWVVTRHCLLLLGSCCLLVACGAQFSAGDATNGGSGALGAGAAAGGTASSGGRAGNDARAESAGADPADAGSVMGDAGSGGGPLVGTGGSSSRAGAGGSDTGPAIPQVGLLLWLRADLGVQQAGGRVQAWLDQSGNQANAVQTGSNVRPEFSTTGLNDLPTLKFDGSGQFLKLPDGFGDFNSGLAGFMVVEPVAADCSSVLELSNGSEIDDIALGMWLDKWSYEVDEPFIQNGNVDVLAPTLYAVNHRPTVGTSKASAGLRINGSLLRSMEMPVPKMIAREDNFIGHTLYGSCNYFEGSVSEIILYQRAVTSSEVASIESYLVQHWDLGAIAAP